MSHAFLPYLKNGLILTAFVLGAAIALPIRAKPQGTFGTLPTRREALVALLQASEREKADLKKEIENLRNQVSEHQRDILSGESSLAAIERDLMQAKILAGLVPVTGPGVEIELRDSPNRVHALAAGDSETSLIHDSDLILVLNELRAAGAEAISIRSGETEERIVSTTFVRCTGPTVVVNNEKMTSPFTVRAIGDPEVLYNSLTIRDGVIDQLRVFGIQVTITKTPILVIGGFSGATSFKHTQPVKLATEAKG